ncbi:MAG: hypothetical protein IPG53_13620 [Ignavibacteriales bacterium]|nr:hypothetical protein [Ignavibacteriales bacterium]
MKIELHLKYIRILLLTVVFSGILTAQKVELFPGDLNIQPFTSNFLEPRMGVFFQSGKNDLRLDIGASKDIARFTGNNGTLFSIGADFLLIPGFAVKPISISLWMLLTTFLDLMPATKFH